MLGGNHQVSLNVLLYKYRLLCVLSLNSDFKLCFFFFMFLFLRHIHFYQSAAPQRSCCWLEAVSGLQTLPALLGRRRYATVWQLLYKYSSLDCGCKETKHTYIFINQTLIVCGSTKLKYKEGCVQLYLLNNIITGCFYLYCTNLLLKESAMEKQNTLPPRIQRMEPPHPIKRAAPNSYLETMSNT